MVLKLDYVVSNVMVPVKLVDDASCTRCVVGNATVPVKIVYDGSGTRRYGCECRDDRGLRCHSW